MNIDELINSDAFAAFLDEDLRREAVQAVETILQESKSVKRHQMHVIPSVIQAGGLGSLRTLAQKQKEKNTDLQNKAFWERIDRILNDQLVSFVRSWLLKCHCIQSEEETKEKSQQKEIRKRNKQLVDMVLEHIIGVYFEHFNCHYFYTSLRGKP